MNGSILTEEDRKLLIRVNRLLEEVLEALEVMGDNETVKAIREAEEDVKAGRGGLERYKIQVMKRFEKDFRKLDLEIRRRVSFYIHLTNNAIIYAFLPLIWPWR